MPPMTELSAVLVVGILAGGAAYLTCSFALQVKEAVQQVRRHLRD